MTQDQLEKEFEILFDEMIQQQKQKVLQIARDRLPHLTGDDVLNPHDFPQLVSDPFFNYEEGLAAGLISAQIAMRARLFRRN